jgi:hypothetical protein
VKVTPFNRTVKFAVANGVTKLARKEGRIGRVGLDQEGPFLERNSDPDVGGSQSRSKLGSEGFCD